MKKVTTKKVKATDATEEVYDEFGVCIACKGDVEGCLHNNLVQEQGVTRCLTCGLII